MGQLAFSLLLLLPDPSVAAAPQAHGPVVTYVIRRDALEASHAECRARQSANPGAAFCPRLFRDPPTGEGGRYEVPEDLVDARTRSAEVGLPWKLSTLHLSFRDAASCQKELRRQDRKFGDVLALFAHYDPDLAKVCEGLLRNALLPLWHFEEGSIHSASRRPALLTGELAPGKRRGRSGARGN